MGKAPPPIELDPSVNFDEVMRKLLTAKPKPRVVAKKVATKKEGTKK